MKRRIKKRRIAALALALLAFPATALAAPQDLRHSAPSSSLGVAPDVASRHAVPSYLPTTGTDVAAPDQQSSPRGDSITTESASSGFDWTDAGIGAAGAVSLLGLSLAGALALRRRTSALAG